MDSPLSSIRKYITIHTPTPMTSPHIVCDLVTFSWENMLSSVFSSHSNTRVRERRVRYCSTRAMLWCPTRIQSSCRTQVVSTSCTVFKACVGNVRFPTPTCSVFSALESQNKMTHTSFNQDDSKRANLARSMNRRTGAAKGGRRRRRKNKLATFS